MRVSDVTRRSRPFPGKKKNITLRFLNEATSARGALSGAHAVPRLFRAPSPTLRTRTTRSNDPRPDLLAPHLPGDPSRSIRRNFPRLSVGRESFHVVLPRRRRGRDRRARARTPGRRALTPRRCAQDQRPDAPGTRLGIPNTPIPRRPEASELPARGGVPACGRRDNLLRGASGGFGGRRRGPRPRRAGRHRRVPARAEASASSLPRPRSATSPQSPRDAN